MLTHGHQDHIGALPYLLREIEDRRVPVYGTPFTLALLEGQLEEHQVLDRAEFRQVTPGEDATAGPFSMRFIRVTHSIPDGMAVVIDTPVGSILHTGDFKVDQTPLDGRPTDLHALAEEAGRGVHLLLSDSTNAEETGYTSSERSVGPVLQDIISRAPQIVVVACFSSHIHRIQQVVNAARADERVVAFLGRSMHQSVDAARELGILHAPEQDVVPIEDVSSLDPSRVVVICTGSQGEPFSALSLMAAREHKWVKLREGDTVVLSSSLIPGNEPAIHRVVDGLYRTGADVFHMPAAPVHASGHAAAEELRLMLSLVRPRWFIPIHGERRHLAHHAKIATEVGIAPDHVLICEDGDIVEVGEKVQIAGEAPAGMTFVDGLGIGDVGEIVLRDRRKLSADGVVVVVVAVDAHHGQVLTGPDIVSRGFVFDATSGDILAAARERVMLSLQESAKARGRGPKRARAEHPADPREVLLRGHAAQAGDPARDPGGVVGEDERRRRGRRPKTPHVGPEPPPPAGHATPSGSVSWCSRCWRSSGCGSSRPAPSGAGLDWLLHAGFGVAAVAFPVIALYWGLLLLRGTAEEDRLRMFIGFTVALVGVLALISLARGNPRPFGGYRPGRRQRRRPRRARRVAARQARLGGRRRDRVGRCGPARSADLHRDAAVATCGRRIREATSRGEENVEEDEDEGWRRVGNRSSHRAEHELPVVELPEEEDEEEELEPIEVPELVRSGGGPRRGVRAPAARAAPDLARVGRQRTRRGASDGGARADVPHVRRARARRGRASGSDRDAVRGRGRGGHEGQQGADPRRRHRLRARDARRADHRPDPGPVGDRRRGAEQGPRLRDARRHPAVEGGARRRASAVGGARQGRPRTRAAREPHARCRTC